MTTAAQVKGMVRPLLDRNPDLALVGRWLYLKPIHHFTRGIVIDGTSSKEHFNPRSAVLHLFEIHQAHFVSWGQLILNRRSRFPGIWSISDADVAISLVEAIENQVLPELRAMRTLDDYLKYVSDHPLRHHLFDWPSSRIIADIAFGDLTNARAICDKNIEYWSKYHAHLDNFDRGKHLRMRELCRLLALNDLRGLVQLLHAWEAEMVRSFKIAHLWEPTPFPLERLL